METEEIKGILISRNASLKIVIFVDDQVRISTSEKYLQISVPKLNNIINKYGMTVSSEKTKAFCGRELTRCKIVIDNKIIAQINTFNYLGCSLSYEVDKYIDAILLKFLKLPSLST